MFAKRIVTPLDEETARSLSTGDRVLISGIVYTARDAAHARMIDLIRQGKDLPFDLTGQIIYYAGPSPAKPGRVIGSIGPTTSYRMDKYTPELIARGLRGMIGKGKRSSEVIQAMKEHGAVYFAAYGGVAAVLSKAVQEASVVAWEDLGAEAVRKLVVKDFPAVVAVDSRGRDIYEEGVLAYKALD